MLAQSRRIVCQPLAMPLGVWVLSFDAARQSEEYGFGPFQFIGKGFQAKQGADTSDQWFALHRLVQKIVGSGFDPCYSILGGSQCRNQNYRNQHGFRVALDPTANFGATELGHVHVQQKKVWSHTSKLCQCHLAVPCDHNLVALDAKQPLQAREAGLVIVRNNNRGWDGHGRNYPRTFPRSCGTQSRIERLPM